MKIDIEPKYPFELFGVEVHKGWWPLVEPIYKRIQELNAAGANIEITQIKEKFGALCIYVHNTPEEIDGMIKKAQEQSIHICEDCGAPADRVVGNYKWIYTLCPNCLKRRGITIVETPEEAEARRMRKPTSPESESSAKIKLFEYPDAKQVIVSGDIHGDFKGIVFKLCVQYGLKDTLLIVAGDCGFGFEKPGYYETVYNQVAGRLRKANNWVLFIRGNHDDPSYFSEEKISYKRWRCVPDYSIIHACGHNILCVGGATSIDRYMRKDENASRRERGHVQTAVWWPDEPPMYDEDALAFIPVEHPIDTVVSHTAPSFCELNSHSGLQSWAAMDSELIDDVNSERKVMDQVFKALMDNEHPVERWYYGHFHQSWNGQREGILFSMLDIEEFKEIHAKISTE